MFSSAIFESYVGNQGGVDFDSSHKIIGALIDVLQNKFKEDTHYEHPLMPPQANILFTLDGAVANAMILYMSATLKDVGGFTEGEFRFTRKSGGEMEGSQRVRLEFTQGVTTEILRKVLMTTDELGKMLAQNAQSQNG